MKGEIGAEDYKSKHKVFKKRSTDIYIQQNYYCYNPRIGYSNFFKDIKIQCEKESYLKVKFFEIRQAIAKLLLSSHNLAIVTEK